MRLTHLKGSRVAVGPAFEKWNSFSRIAVFGDTGASQEAFGWGLSTTYDKTRRVRQMSMNIDGTASTVMTAFDGNL